MNQTRNTIYSNIRLIIKLVPFKSHTKWCRRCLDMGVKIYWYRFGRVSIVWNNLLKLNIDLKFTYPFAELPAPSFLSRVLMEIGAWNRRLPVGFYQLILTRVFNPNKVARGNTTDKHTAQNIRGVRLPSNIQFGGNNIHRKPRLQVNMAINTLSPCKNEWLILNNVL